MTYGGGRVFEHCPRCSGKLVRDGMVRCTACGSVWLDEPSIASEWETKHAATGYVEEDFINDLSGLVAVTQASTMREMAGHLKTAAGMREETINELTKGTPQYYKYEGELEALRDVTDWMNKQADKAERDYVAEAAKRKDKDL